MKRGNKRKQWVMLYADSSCSWIGEPLVFAANSNLNDYHQNMNSDSFQNYFEGLCAWMQKMYPDWFVIFHMDNAAYYKKINGLKGPLSSLKKAELCDWL